MVVLDRPNPLGGVDIEGGAVAPSAESFVGLGSVPVRHGMTIGEIARLVRAGIPWGGDASPSRWTAIWRSSPMRGWRRRDAFEATGLPWVMPSPNMPTLDTALVYPGLCLFEGTNLSEGRGTTRPFEIVGAPFLDGHRLAERLRRLRPARGALPAAVVPAHLPQVRRQVLRRRAAARHAIGATFRPYRTGVAILRGCGRWGAMPSPGARSPTSSCRSAGHRSADRQRRVRLRRRARGAAGGDLRRWLPAERDFAERRGRPAVLSCYGRASDAKCPMRVALFGGSFNPPHVAHQLVALYVLETARVDELWLVPASSTPSTRRWSPSTTAAAMCELAAAGAGPARAGQRHRGAPGR